jgi:S1-C subfamily serine protease
MKPYRPIFVLFAVLALSALACTQSLEIFSPTQATFPATPTSQGAVYNLPPGIDLLASQDTLSELYERVSPGVVAIRVLTEMGQGQGSGFVFDTQGHIVTNYHVVEGHTDLEVAFTSGLKARGHVVATDLDSDLAIVKVEVDPAELLPLPLGDSSQIRVGQTVIAIGNPFGLRGTMTLGIISGLGRTLSSLHTTAEGSSFTSGDIIQTDAAINPGNSGGPLLNLNGEVIGVNQAIRTNNYSAGGEPLNSGVGFAIPVNIVQRVAPFLISDGYYDYPYMGIYSARDLTLVQQEALSLPQSTGVYVTNIAPGGPADKAGVKGASSRTNIPNLMGGGDLIVAVDGRPVDTFNDLIGYVVANRSPGETIVLSVLRDGRALDLSLTLEKRP